MGTVASNLTDVQVRRAINIGHLLAAAVYEFPGGSPSDLLPDPSRPGATAPRRDLVSRFAEGATGVLLVGHPDRPDFDAFLTKLNAQGVDNDSALDACEASAHVLNAAYAGIDFPVGNDTDLTTFWRLFYDRAFRAALIEFPYWRARVSGVTPATPVDTKAIAEDAAKQAAVIVLDELKKGAQLPLPAPA